MSDPRLVKHLWLIVTPNLDFIPPPGSFGVDVALTMADLTLTPEDFEKRLTTPAVHRLLALHQDLQARKL